MVFDSRYRRYYYRLGTPEMGCMWNFIFNFKHKQPLGFNTSFHLVTAAFITANYCNPCFCLKFPTETLLPPHFSMPMIQGPLGAKESIPGKRMLTPMLKVQVHL